MSFRAEPLTLRTRRLTAFLDLTETIPAGRSCIVARLPARSQVCGNSSPSTTTNHPPGFRTPACRCRSPGIRHRPNDSTCSQKMVLIPRCQPATFKALEIIMRAAIIIALLIVGGLLVAAPLLVSYLERSNHQANVVRVMLERPGTTSVNLQREDTPAPA